MLFTPCQAQESKLLISKSNISDFSGTPFYTRLVDEEGNEVTWKKEYKYLDSIEIYTILYWSDGLKIEGLLVQPLQKGKYPCVIFNRGGGNYQESSLKVGHGIVTLGQIAKEGYVVIASQYREGGRSEGKDEFGGKDVNDVLQLIEVLEEIEKADTERIGMFGWSRGTIMSFKVLTKTNKLDAVVVGGVVSDCIELVKDRPEMENLFEEMIPDFQKNRHQALLDRSAIYWVDKLPKDVPILMMHGNADWRTKPEQCLKLSLEFEKHRIPYRLIMFEGGDHGISEHKTEVNEQVIKWFDRYLKHDEPIPNMEYHGG